jgi:chromosome segregation protein
VYLKSIKVAGFKSFADLQVINFEHPFTCIVGPNGCGKSNIIDAVKWVIGESSAKNLRGSQLTDVIFNGSTSRKAQGMAKVELIFDNSKGRLLGQWSAFKEITLSRVVYRDGQSHYYLNQTRCRRKDIIDLFLGTGLGPRSYAIIEQGMVNKFIDAKPMEMRLQIEEAAGVSKYKEKRKETYQKLEEAQENLDRLADKKEEMGKRVQSLQKQAEQAKRYQELKEQWATWRLELYALLWASASEDFDKAQKTLSDLKATQSEKIKSFQKFQAQHARSFVELEQKEQYLIDKEQGYQHLQLELKDFQLKWQKGKDRLEYVQRDLEEEKSVFHQIERSLKQNIELENNLAQGSEQENACQELHEASLKAENRARECKLHLEKAQKEYQNLLELKQAPQSQAEVIKSKIQAHEGSLFDQETLIKRSLEGRESIKSQLEELAEQESASSYESEKNNYAQLEKNYENILLNYEMEHQRQSEKKQERHLCEKEIEFLKKQRENKQIRLDKLASKPDKKLQENIGYFRTLFKDEHPKESYAEQFAHLMGSFDLHMVEKPIDVNNLHWETSRKVQICWGPQENHQALLGKMSFPEYFSRYIFLDSWEQVKSHYRQMEKSQVLVLPNGGLLGKNWFSPISREQQETQASLQTELSKIEKHLQKEEKNYHHLVLECEKIHQCVQQLEEEKKRQGQELKKALASLRFQEVSFEKLRLKKEHLKEKKEDVERDLQSSQQKSESLKKEMVILREELEKLLTLIENQESSLEKSHLNVVDLTKTLTQAEQNKELARQVYLEQKAEDDKIEQERIHLEKDRKRLESERERYGKKHQGLLKEIEQISPQLEVLDKEILTLNQQAEVLLAEKTVAIENLEKMKKLHVEITKKRKSFEKDIALHKDNLHQAEIVWEKSLVQQNHIKEQIYDLGLDFEALKKLESQGDKAVLKDQVHQLEQDIEKMGPVNFNACQEFDQESARLRELIEQLDDIEQSCQILKQALDDLDHDIVQTYQKTFESLQKSFSELFPKLFGGGKALLEEVEIEGSKEKGVLVFAQPPGKKNATLNALSGGEKALTAAALVFSFFHLNPAPFCLMDEIDAPLDDSNTARLAQMLDYLSQSVQCLCVTHSKITMEKGHALFGVTMREPGVSRLVSVDLKKAEKMIQ